MDKFVQATMKKLNAIAMRKAHKIASDAAIAWEAWFNLQFYGPKTGNQYRYTNRRGLYHHASAPREYPADKTGRLLDSIQIKVSNFDPNGKVIRIYLHTDVEYAETLVNRGRKLFQESKEEFFVKYFKAKLSGR